MADQYAEATTGNTNSPTITSGFTIAEGDLLIVAISANLTVTYTINSGAGWSQLGSQLSSTDGGAVAYKIAGAGESTTLAPFTATDNRVHNIVALKAEPPSGRVWKSSPLDATNQNTDNDATKTSSTFNPTDGGNGLVYGAAFNNGNDTWSGWKVNGSTTSVVEINSIATGSAGGGNHLTAWYKRETSFASGTYTVEAVSNRSDNGGVFGATFFTDAAGGPVPLSVAITGTSTVAGHLTSLKPLSVGIAGASAVAADLTVEREPVLLAVDIDGQSGVSASLDVVTPRRAVVTWVEFDATFGGLPFVASGLSAVAANLVVTKPLSAAIQGSSTANLDLSVEAGIHLAVDIDGQSEVTVSLDVATRRRAVVTWAEFDTTPGGLAVLMAGMSTMSVGLGLGIPLGLSIQGSSTVSPNLAVFIEPAEDIPLATQIAGQSSMAAELHVGTTIPLSVAIHAQSTFRTRIRSFTPIAWVRAPIRSLLVDVLRRPLTVLIGRRTLRVAAQPRSFIVVVAPGRHGDSSLSQLSTSPASREQAASESLPWGFDFRRYLTASDDIDSDGTPTAAIYDLTNDDLNVSDTCLIGSPVVTGETTVVQTVANLMAKHTYRLDITIHPAVDDDRTASLLLVCVQ